MTEHIQKPREELEQICNSIEEKKYVEEAKRDNIQGWEGAGVYISKTNKDSNKKIVVTSFAGEVGWLFNKLRDVFYKYEFFGRMARAALRYQEETHGKEEGQDMLIEIKKEAFKMLEEIENDSFRCLPAAPPSVVASDIKKSS